LNQISKVRPNGSLAAIQCNINKKEFIAKIKSILELPDYIMAIGIYNSRLICHVTGTIIMNFKLSTKFFYINGKFVFSPSFDIQNPYLSVYKTVIADKDALEVNFIKPHIPLSTTQNIKMVDLSAFKQDMVLAYSSNVELKRSEIWLCDIKTHEVKSSTPVNYTINKILCYGKDKLLVSGDYVNLFSLETMKCLQTVVADPSCYRLYSLESLKKDLYVVACFQNEMLDNIKIYDRDGVYMESDNFADEIKTIVKKGSVDQFRVNVLRDNLFEFLLKTATVINIIKCEIL
jgi:hypothetical protein